jgi:FkbM family methyltransferase
MRNWDLQVRAALRMLPHKEHTLRLRNGWIIHCRPKTLDRLSFNEVWLEEIYEPPQFDWASCKTIVDIGGYIGCASLYFAKHAPHAQIYAFEPSPSNFTALQRNIQSNHLEGCIHATQAAVGATSGTATFFLMDTTGGNSLFQYTNPKEKITVPMVTLEDIFAKYHIATCDFLKIDCEGAEYQILYTAPPALLQKVRLIMLEHHAFTGNPRNTPEELTRFLQTHGFIVTAPHKHVLCARR